VIARYAGGESGARVASRSGSVVVMVDAFRASTTIAVLISKGARVVPVASVAAAASAATDFRIGERGSAKVAGFDFGNSPTEILGSEIPPGSTVALSTTNGTRIVEAARGAKTILTGAFVNAGILAECLAGGTYDGAEVVVVGCGWERRRASEDEAAAGAILHRLQSRGADLDMRARRVVEGYLARSGSGTRRTWSSVSPRTRCLSCRVWSAMLSSGASPPQSGSTNLRPSGQHKKPKLVLDKGMARHYPGVSEGGSNVTNSVESATGRR
jgi:2-phosphosulfolactate phosphatase